MATIKEDYCSKELSLLLDKKGFDGYSTPYSKLILGGLIPHSVAMKWLREVHNIDIFPWKIGKGIYSCAIFDSNTGKDLSSNKDFPSEKYEETVDAAIKYCIENLI